MTILEMHSQAHPATRWIEVCAAEHIAPVPRMRREHRAGDSAKVRPARRSPRSAAPSNIGERARPSGRARMTAAPHIAPSRSIVARQAYAGNVRACSVEAPSVSGVVDDVPTWVLLACGFAFGVILLLVLALLGGPAYG